MEPNNQILTPALTADKIPDIIGRLMFECYTVTTANDLKAADIAGLATCAASIIYEPVIADSLHADLLPDVEYPLSAQNHIEHYSALLAAANPSYDIKRIRQLTLVIYLMFLTAKLPSHLSDAAMTWLEAITRVEGE